MEKYQTRSTSSNFFGMADTLDDIIADSKAGAVQVDLSEVALNPSP